MPIFSDDFTGTDSDPWSASNWESAVSGGGGNSRSIQSNKGYISKSSGAFAYTNSEAILTSGDGQAYNFEWTGAFDVPNSGQHYLHLWFRADSIPGGKPDNTYRIQFKRFDSEVLLTRVVDGSDVDLATFSWGATSSQYRFRLRAQDDHIQFRLWLDGASEPGTWDIDFYDSTYFQRGLIAVGAGRGPSGTAEVNFDDFEIEDLGGDVPVDVSGARYETDFSQYTNGVTPFDWTLIGSGAAMSVSEESNPAGGKIATLTSTAGGENRKFLWDQISADTRTDNVDIVVMMRQQVTNEWRGGILARSNQETSAAAMRHVVGSAYESDGVRFFDWPGSYQQRGTEPHDSDIDVGDWAYFRLRLDGADWYIAYHEDEADIVLSGDTPVGGWTATGTNSSYLTAGGAGLWLWSSGDFDVGWYSAGTGTIRGRAPSEAIEEVPEFLRIMAAGDSITEGNNGWSTYRRWYIADMETEGVTVEMVGQYDTPETGTYAGQGSWDHDHQALWGEYTADLEADMAGEITAYQPQILLLLIGTNDVRSGGATTDLDASIDNVEDVIEAARSEKADIKVLLGIPPVESDATSPIIARFDDWEDKLNALASAMSTGLSPVKAVDLKTSYNPSWYRDTLHPDEDGENFIADQFVSATGALFVPSTFDGSYVRTAAGTAVRIREAGGDYAALYDASGDRWGV